MKTKKSPTDSLKLSNQLCFPIYSVSKLLTKAYKPYLTKLGITYPQYLVMLVLWEQDHQTVNDIAAKLLLNTNTLSPLLQRMEKQEIIQRNRCQNDERSVIVCLSKKGKEMQKPAASIPNELLEILVSENVSLPDIKRIKGILDHWIEVLTEEEKNENK